MAFCGVDSGVTAGSKVMVVWGELQAGGEALQVRSLVVAGPKILIPHRSSHAVYDFHFAGFCGGTSKASGKPAKVKLEQRKWSLRNNIFRIAVENSLRVGLAGHPKSSFNAIFSGCVGLATVWKKHSLNFHNFFSQAIELILLFRWNTTWTCLALLAPFLHLVESCPLPRLNWVPSCMQRQTLGREEDIFFEIDQDLGDARGIQGPWMRS